MTADRRVAGPGPVPPRQAGPASVTFDVWGMQAHLAVTDAGRLTRARSLLAGWLGTVGDACDRFRPDSEISVLNAAGGRPVAISAIFAQILDEALRVARLTGGAVDPTIGGALVAAGYDRDLRAVQERHDASRWPDAPPSAGPGVRWRRAAGWRSIELNRITGTVRIPPEVRLDLGATGKAFAADRAAGRIAAATGCGVLVALGGDISVAGPPPEGGWPVHVAEDHRSGPEAPGQTVTIESGGLATSSTTLRRWPGRTGTLHHIIDPLLGAPARTCWRTVTAAAATCVDANAATTAALVMGEGAPSWLTEVGVPARLVRTDGTVSLIGGWPGPGQEGRAPEGSGQGLGAA